MKILTHGIISVILICLLVGCDTSTPAPAATPDVALVQLTEMAAQALPLAQKIVPSAVLRQVDTDAFQTIFDYTDSAATQEITVWVKSPGAPLAQWQAQAAPKISLVNTGEPELDLKSVKIGLSRAAQIITVYWTGCLLQTLTLYTQNAKPTWLGFCKTSDGIVSGLVDAQSGNLQVTNASPIAFPGKGTPLP